MSVTEWAASAAAALAPWGVIVAFLGSISTLVFAIVKFRSLFYRLFAGLATPREGGIFRRLFTSLDDSKKESKAAKENSQRTIDALLLMTEALVEERKASEQLQASRDVEAKQKDELLARTLRTLARYDQASVLDRLGRLERARGGNTVVLPTEPVGELVFTTGRHAYREESTATIQTAAAELRANTGEQTVDPFA